ncbi:MAG TPA: hypothetical protein VJL33_06360 [Candidatus Bathyarchaeia archaeon]|nr:hypothetical protein [Candidatus Bathyarchaeia archaeon]
MEFHRTNNIKRVQQLLATRNSKPPTWFWFTTMAMEKEAENQSKNSKVDYSSAFIVKEIKTVSPYAVTLDGF